MSHAQRIPLAKQDTPLPPQPPRPRAARARRRPRSTCSARWTRGSRRCSGSWASGSSRQAYARAGLAELGPHGRRCKRAGDAGGRGGTGFEASRRAASGARRAHGSVAPAAAERRRAPPQASELGAALDAARRSVAARDAEIARLSAQLGTGPDVDRLALERRADVSEEIVLTLNKQVTRVGGAGSGAEWGRDGVSCAGAAADDDRGSSRGLGQPAAALAWVQLCGAWHAPRYMCISFNAHAHDCTRTTTAPIAQIDSMGSELVRLRQAASDGAKLQAALGAAERARAEAEERLSAVLRDNAGALVAERRPPCVRVWRASGPGILQTEVREAPPPTRPPRRRLAASHPPCTPPAVMRDVSRLQQEMRRLELSQARAGAAAGQEVDTAVAAVSSLT